MLYSITFFQCFPGSSVSSRLDPCHRVQVQNQRAQHPLSLQEEQGGRPRQVGRRHDQVLLQRRHLPHAGRRATSPFSITKASSFHNNYFFLLHSFHLILSFFRIFYERHRIYYTSTKAISIISDISLFLQTFLVTMWLTDV